MIRVLRPFFAVVVALIVLIVLMFGVAAPFGLQAFQAVETGRTKLLEAEYALIEKRDIAGAEVALHGAVQAFEDSNRNLSRIQYLSVLPWISRNLKAVRAGVNAAHLASRALQSTIAVVKVVYEPLRSEVYAGIGDIPKVERETILRDLQTSIPILYDVKVELEQGLTFLAQVPHDTLIPVLRRELDELEGRLTLVRSVLADGIPLVEVAPSLLGYPEARRYLFILQNSDEMRPSGGFLGTYGMLTFDAGHITEFATDDVYNLDREVPAHRRPFAPEPIKNYLEQPRWYLRDANWSPDFPISAQRILQFYGEEHKAVCNQKRQPVLHASCLPAQAGPMLPDDIDGVIAIMPEAIRPLLQLTGPITVSGQTFTAANLTDALEFEVEIGFEKKGIPRPQRKAIISELGHALIAKIMTLPSSSWPEVLHVVRTALDEKHMLLYVHDPTSAQLHLTHGWSGAIEPAPLDYLAVFDANMFALKTDPYVARAIFYNVGWQGEHLTGEVEIVYSYPKEGPAWKTKGYRTWTQVYVPKGSILTQAFGAMKEEESRIPGEVEVRQESDKAVFGAFLAVQVGEVKRLRFRYRLPDYIARAVSQERRYELAVQKQPGTSGHTLTVAADFGTLPRIWNPRGLSVTRENSKLIWKTSLRRDQEFKVEF